MGIEIVEGCIKDTTIDEKFFGAVIQCPNEKGAVNDYSEFVEKVHKVKALLTVAVDIMSLALMTPPGEWGADIVIGSTQRFGIPMGFGGPHATYLASREEFKRFMPGRIIGVSVDAKGNRALRMALQTREQHIKRERATSNICTAQALLAIMAGMYAVYHGPCGIKAIAKNINILAGVLSDEIQKLGYTQANKYFFDTLQIKLPAGVSLESIKKSALEKQMNFRYIDAETIGVSIDETTELKDINTILQIFANANNKAFKEFVCNKSVCEKITTIPNSFARESKYLQHSIFNKYHSETAMMRYLKRLENKDLALNRTMIPLGSCTMKLNAAAEMLSLSWPEFGNIHPFVPVDQAEGYLQL